jgi:drug/metabolite transporter (DMT)-like permease
MTLFAYGVGQLGASRAAAFISLIPGVVALMAVPWLGESIGVEAIAGIAVVSFGVALVSRHRTADNLAAASIGSSETKGHERL